MGKWEEFTHDVVNFQEAQVNEGVTVGEFYKTHKLGLLRFYLFTETLTSEDDPSEEADIQTDDQCESATESGQDRDAMVECDQFTKNTGSGVNEIHTVEDNDQSTATLSAVVSPVAVQIIDPTSRCNTSEIVFGPLTDGPFLGDLDDAHT